MTARDDLIHYAASTRTVTADGLAPYIDRVEQEALIEGADRQRELRRLEALEQLLIDYINGDAPPMVGHILTGLMALASASDEK